VQNFTGNGLTNLSRVVVLMAGIVILIFLENAHLALIALLPLIPLVFITTNFGGRMSKIYYKVDHALGVLSSRLQENVAGAQVVRAFAREEYEITRFEKADQTLFQAQVGSMRQFAKVLPGTHALVALSTILILWFGGRMVMQGELSLGELVAFNSYLVLLALPVQQLAWLVNQAGEASAGLKRTFEVLQICPEIRSKKNAVVLGTLKGKVEFRNVNFKYQGEKSPALHNINLEVKPNQVIALIGGTGSGKTSMINLIPRFYDASEGQVLIDGVDVRDLQIEALRKQIGIVLQSTLLFSMSIKDNLAYGNPDLSLEEIIDAAKMAQAHEFIMELPEGYETIVGERGVTLSGGQRQRVAIARAILMDPRIMILDDSTSSVDTHTEKLIQKALYRLMEGRTTFVIAQRLSTVQRADRILVMDKGAIVEQGTHAELLEKGGIYQEIYSLQLRDQEKTMELADDEGGNKNA
jgi:ATP-binding cassette subfamily B protein